MNEESYRPLMNLPVIIFGAGEHGRIVLDAALAAGWRVTFVVDDAPLIHELYGVPVAKSRDAPWGALGAFRFIAAIGDNTTRQSVFLKLRSMRGEAVNLVHPHSFVSSKAKLGAGVFVGAGAIINTNAVIEDDVIINTAASVDHDCRIGSHVHLCPGVRLAGHVSIGKRTFVGMGSCLLPGVSVGEDAVIGAGSVVNRPLQNGTLAYGVPAKVRNSVGSSNGATTS